MSDGHDIDQTDGEREMALVQKHVDALGEHYDSVLIFVTRHDVGAEGGTVNLSVGSGNWFARYGQVREWLIKTDEVSREFVKRKEREE